MLILKRDFTKRMIVLTTLFGMLFTMLTPGPAFAAISFGSTATNQSGPNPVLILTISRPGSTASGDLLLAGIAVNEAETSTITPPSGWTFIQRIDNASDVGLATYYKVAGASEPISYDFGVDKAGSAIRASGGITAYSGVNTVSPIDVIGSNSGDSSIAVAPSVTTTAAGDMVVALFGVGDKPEFSTPAGMTERYDIFNLSTSGPNTALDDVLQAAIGASGTKTADMTFEGPPLSAKWVAQTIALKASMVSQNSTTTAPATAVAGVTTIAVSMPYSGDDNANNTYTVDYKLSADVEWTNWVTNASHTASPYEATITGLFSSSSYDVRATYNDSDGVTGTNPQMITNIVTTTADPANYVAPAGTDRVVVVAASAEIGTAINNVQIGGVAATTISLVQNNNAQIYTGYRVIGSSATSQNMAVTANVATTIFVKTYQNINQNTGNGPNNTINSIATGTASNGTTTTNTNVFNAPSGAVTNLEGGQVVYAINMNLGSADGQVDLATSTAWAFNELFDRYDNDGGNRTGVGEATTKNAGSSLVRVTATTNHNRSALIAFSLNPISKFSISPDNSGSGTGETPVTYTHTITNYGPVPLSTLQGWSQRYASTSYPSGSIGNYPISAGSNRLLVVAISSTRTSPGGQTVSNVTYGGQSLTLAAGDGASTGTWNHTYLYYLNEAGIQAATSASLNITIAGGTSHYNWVYASVFSGVDQTTPLTDARNFNSGSTANRVVGPFNPPLAINAGDQAAEIINLARSNPGGAVRNISTWATGWGTNGGSIEADIFYDTKNINPHTYITNRAAVPSNIIDGSEHTASGAAWDSMTAISIKPSYQNRINLSKSDSLAAQGWTSEIWNSSETTQISSVTLAPYSSVDIKVKVYIPAGAPSGAVNTTTITGTSTHNGFTESATDTTTANASSAMMIIEVFNPEAATYDAIAPFIMSFGDVLANQNYYIGQGAYTIDTHAVKLEARVFGNRYSISTIADGDFIADIDKGEVISATRLQYGIDADPLTPPEPTNWTSFSSTVEAIIFEDQTPGIRNHYLDYRLWIDWDTDPPSSLPYSTTIIYTLTALPL
ncbi:MAG: hypothetical protein QMD53_00455 [Actinomycetota bacterium]|nr:hypothetical protein [Actinomycetota bacterium]